MAKFCWKSSLASLHIHIYSEGKNEAENRNSTENAFISF